MSLFIPPLPLPSFSEITTPFSDGMDRNHTQGGSQEWCPGTTHLLCHLFLP